MRRCWHCGDICSVAMRIMTLQENASIYSVSQARVSMQSERVWHGDCCCGREYGSTTMSDAAKETERQWEGGSERESITQWCSMGFD
jgi:hypothetical protein